MRLDANKVQLINRDQIKMAVSVFIDHEFSKEDIYSKIVTIFNVDLDQLDEVLYSSDNLDLDFQKSSEDSDVSTNAFVNSRIEQFKLMVATKYWNGLSENNIQ
jgi:nitrous oxidase accessory protein NosD